MISEERSGLAHRRPLAIGLVALVLALAFVAAGYAAAFSVVGLVLFAAGLAFLSISVGAFLISSARWVLGRSG